MKLPPPFSPLFFVVKVRLKNVRLSDTLRLSQSVMWQVRLRRVNVSSSPACVDIWEIGVKSRWTAV